MKTIETNHNNAINHNHVALIGIMIILASIVVAVCAWIFTPHPINTISTSFWIHLASTLLIGILFEIFAIYVWMSDHGNQLHDLYRLRRESQSNEPTKTDHYPTKK